MATFEHVDRETGEIVSLRARHSRREQVQTETAQLPAIPEPGHEISEAMVVSIENAIASTITEVMDIELLQEHRAKSTALETYAKSKGLREPMMGASRRIEAQIGVLLGPAENGVNQHTAPGGLSHAITLIKRANDREDFRILANAMNGNVPLAPEEWRKSRRALVKLLREKMGLVPDEVEEEEKPNAAVSQMDPVARCAAMVRRVVLEQMDGMEQEQLIELISELRAEIDDIERAMTNRSK